MSKDVESITSSIAQSGFSWIGPPSEYDSVRSSRMTVKCNGCGAVKTRSLKHLKTWKCTRCSVDYVTRLAVLGWKYLSGEYSNRDSVLYCGCMVCKAVSSKPYRAFRSGCIHCQRSKSKKYNSETIREHIQVGHSLRYFRGNLVGLECKVCGYAWSSVVYDYVSQKRRCGRCVGNAPVDAAVFQGEIESSGYSLVDSIPVSSETRFTMTCPKGHNFKASRHTWKSGNRCPHCVRSRSKMEDEFMGFFPDQMVIPNYRPSKEYEIDVYFPEHNIGVEMNGDYWHSEEAGYDRNRHSAKFEFCREIGIRLFQFFEHEWKADPAGLVQVVRSLIEDGPLPVSGTVTQDNRFPIYHGEIVDELTASIVPGCRYTVYDAGRMVILGEHRR